MYELDFLPVEAEDGNGTKSGDAITGRFWLADGTSRVIVVDAGYSAIGENVVDHVQTYYDTDRIDLLVSTHPDADHLNGLVFVLENLSVGELLIHRPREHFVSGDAELFSNIERVDAVIALAESQGVTVTEPFRGLTRWGGQFRVLGPTLDYYRSLIQQYILDERSGVAATARAKKSLTAAFSKAMDLLSRALPFLPPETLEEDPVTSHRNNTSTVLLLSDNEKRVILTGDAGVPALSLAADEYERVIGEFATAPVDLFQVPHHGSRHNLSPSLLDRVIGPIGATVEVVAVVSSAKASTKHPNPKVTNALLRRSAHVVATEGHIVCSQNNVNRAGWTPIPSLGPLVEDSE